MYSFNQTLEQLVQIKGENPNTDISRDQIIAAINPISSELPGDIRSNIISGSDLGEMISVLNDLYSSDLVLKNFKAEAQQTFSEALLDCIPFMRKSEKQVRVEEAKNNYSEEYDYYSAKQEQLREYFDALDKEITDNVKKVRINNVLGFIHCAADTSDINIDDPSRLRKYFENKIDVKLDSLKAQVIQQASALGIEIDTDKLEQLKLLKNKYKNKLSGINFVKYITGIESSSTQDKIKSQFQKHFADYKDLLLTINRDYLDQYLSKINSLTLSKTIREHSEKIDYKKATNTICSNLSSTLGKMVELKHSDDFATALWLTGKPLNSLFLTIYGYNSIPYATVIKELLCLVYGPLIIYYAKILDKIKKMKANNTYTLFNMLVTCLQLILPALVMLATFIFLAPLINDFLLALIIPAGMSMVICLFNYLSIIVSTIINGKKFDDNINERLINIFGEAQCHKVIAYYKSKTENIEKEIFAYEREKHLTLSSEDAMRLNQLKNKLTTLQNEWQALSYFNSSEPLTTEQARDIYFTRMAKSAVRKVNKQSALYKETKEDIISEFNKELSEDINMALSSTSTGSVTVVKVPVRFSALVEGSKRRQDKIQQLELQLNEYLPSKTLN